MVASLTRAVTGSLMNWLLCSAAIATAGLSTEAVQAELKGSWRPVRAVAVLRR